MRSLPRGGGRGLGSACLSFSTCCCKSVRRWSRSSSEGNLLSSSSTLALKVAHWVSNSLNRAVSTGGTARPSLFMSYSRYRCSRCWSAGQPELAHVAKVANQQRDLALTCVDKHVMQFTQEQFRAESKEQVVPGQASFVACSLWLFLGKDIDTANSRGFQEIRAHPGIPGRCPQRLPVPEPLSCNGPVSLQTSSCKSL